MKDDAAVIEAHAVNSEPDTGSCGQCEHCRCGESRATDPQITAASQGANAPVLPLASITTPHHVGGSESHLHPAGGADS